MNGVKPDCVTVVPGVPQGTVLGPLVFSVHINDITADIECEKVSLKMTVFVDKEGTFKLQRYIKPLGNWTIMEYDILISQIQFDAADTKTD